MPILVIGAGLFRTGTASTREALNQLGLGPCYHMLENRPPNDDSDTWVEVLEAQKAGDMAALRKYIKSLFNGEGRKQYQSTTDLPGALFYKELMQIYPEAKVLLTVRDNASKWFKSACDTVANPQGEQNMIKKSEESPRLKRVHNMLCQLIWDNPDMMAGKLREGDQEWCESFYNRWNDAVRQHVPAGQLLEFNAKQGWAPLCEWLGLPEPDVPFPHVNDTASFREMVNRKLEDE